MGTSEYEKEYSTQPILFVESEEIVDVPIFSEATRMPIPERTYTQELLDRPIPLENRIAHLIPYAEPVAGILTQYMIARLIGADPEWVVRVAERTGIATLPEDKAERISVRQYASPALEVLQEEWDWYRAYKELDDLLTETAIAKFVAKSVHWVRKTAHELEVFPTDKVVKSGRERPAYKKTLIPQLRHLLLLFPPADDWATKRELIELTGKDWPWIEAQLKKTAMDIMERRSPFNGGVYDYIAPQSRSYLSEVVAQLPEAAGNGLTIEAISKRIGRSPHWILRRMPEGYESLGLERTDDREIAGLHYFEDVWGPLQEQVKAEENDKRLARIAIAKAVGKSWAWVESRLPYTNVDPEEKTNQNYHVFDEKVVGELKDIAEEEASDTRLSVGEIAKILGHTPYWVKARLPFTSANPEEKRGKTYVVYNAKVVDQLRSLPVNTITMGPNKITY